MEIANDLITLFVRLCDTFNKTRFTYCVVGGFAVGMWGPPRGTSDIDIVILLREEERGKVVLFLEEHFNMIQSHDKDMVFGDFHIWRHVFAGENKRNVFPLDMIIASTEYLENVLNRRLEIEYRGVTVPVISIEDLIILKSISFRDIDQFDIKNLVNSGSPIDWDYLDKKLSQLVPQKQRTFIDALRT
ncbi:MAG: nucleotidyltransferase family protein [bacterium]|nr:nucleotidyltransferase family protein [bacterium]